MFIEHACIFYNLCEFSCSICKVIGTSVHFTFRQLLMIMKQNTSVFYLGFKTTYMYLHDTLIILVETNLHASCPESGVVIGSMVSYLVDQYGHISVLSYCHA